MPETVSPSENTSPLLFTKTLFANISFPLPVKFSITWEVNLLEYSFMFPDTSNWSERGNLPIAFEILSLAVSHAPPTWLTTWKVSSYFFPKSLISFLALATSVELPIFVFTYDNISVWYCASLIVLFSDILFCWAINSGVPGVLDNLDHIFLSSWSIGSTDPAWKALNLGIGSWCINLWTVVFVFLVNGSNGFKPLSANSTSLASYSFIPALSGVKKSGPQLALARTELRCTCLPAKWIWPFSAPCICEPFKVYDEISNLA